MSHEPGRSMVEHHTSFGAGWLLYDAGGPVEMGLPDSAPPVSPSTGNHPPDVVELIDGLSGLWSGGELPIVDDIVIRRAGTTLLMRSIYETVVSIPRGATMTYAEVGAAVGRPEAPRAVGAAMARNPFAPVIPCHRVVGSDGSLRGYGGGLGMKSAMLTLEGANV